MKECIKIFLVSILICGCSFGPKPSSKMEENLDFPDCLVRARAITYVAENKKTEKIGNLIVMLADEDVNIRMLSNKALERLTGVSFDFIANAPEQERDEAIEKWKNWWNNNKSNFISQK